MAAVPQTIWAFVNIGVFIFMFLGIREGHDTAKFLLPFMGFLIGIFLIVAVNSGGGIAVHYPQFATDTQINDPVWPDSYLTLFLLLGNLAVLLRNGISR